MIEVLDATPAFADVFSGAVPRPVLLLPGAEPLFWARQSAAVLRLCALRGLQVTDLTVELNAKGAAALAAALGDAVLVVFLAGRLVVLNADGTRAAYYTAGDVSSESGGDR